MAMAFSSTHILSTPNKTPKITITTATKKPSFVIPRSSSSSSDSDSDPSSSFDLRSYWTSLLSQINSHLDSSIPVRFPDTIYLSMRHSLLSPSAKRAPPIMCIAAFHLFLGSSDRASPPPPISAALPTAAALEMVHTASLIHDDLPSFDSAPLRRGLPSNHSLFGTHIAILAGDALFPLAFQHIVSHTPETLVPPQTLLRVVQEISRTVGSSGMALGQFLDLSAADVGEAEALSVVEKKFGEMAECSAVCGGLLGGAQEGDLERLRRYGRAVGVLYQLVDEVLLMEEEEGNGRSAKMRSNVSVVRAVGMERAMEIVEELRGKAKAEVEALGESYGDRVLPLASFVDYAVDRGFVIENELLVS